MNAGLEPFAGFLHVDRPGKPSLVLDMVEEFRQPVVDRAVIAAIGRGTAIETQEGMLTDTRAGLLRRLCWSGSKARSTSADGVTSSSRSSRSRRAIWRRSCAKATLRTFSFKW